MNEIAIVLIGLHRYEEALHLCREGLSDADIESPGAIVVLKGTMANCLLKVQRTGEPRNALARIFELCCSIEWRSFESSANGRANRCAATRPLARTGRPARSGSRLQADARTPRAVDG
jgi:hypothetical protein